MRALIWVESESQKGILVGARGRMIKAIGVAARRELERELGAQVYLDLSVRVRRDWRGDEGLLDRLGIGSPLGSRAYSAALTSARRSARSRQGRARRRRGREGEDLEVSAAQASELIVLEACAVVHGARGQRGGACRGARLSFRLVDPVELRGGEAPGQGAVDDHARAV